MKLKRSIYLLLVVLGLGTILVARHTNISQLSTYTTVDFAHVVNLDEKPSQQQTLRVAVAAMTSPHVTRKIYYDLINYIGEQLEMKVSFIQRPTYAELIPLLRDDKIDLAFICSGTYALCSDEFGWELLVIPIIGGKKTYNSEIIVRNDSPYKTFSDLRNKSFAFTCEGSNTGEIYPNYYLRTLGENAQRFFSRAIFSLGHDNSIRAVSSGLVDGAAVDSLILNYMRSKNDPAAQQVRIIHHSQPFGMPPVTVSPQLDSSIKKKLQQLFLTVHKAPRGKEILEQLQIDYFTHGDDSDYDSIREMIATCNEHAN